MTHATPDTKTTARTRGRSNVLTNIALLVAAALIFAVAIVLGTRSGGEFGGTDAAATEQIEKSDSSYKPWFQPLWENPGGEVESGLFALQAAIGAGIVGFALGTFRERRQHTKTQRPVDTDDAAGSDTDADTHSDANGVSDRQRASHEL